MHSDFWMQNIKLNENIEYFIITKERNVHFKNREKGHIILEFIKK